MRQLFGVLVALLLFSAWGGTAQAQVESHDFKLTLDASVVQWTKHTSVYDLFGDDIEEKSKTTAVGFLGAGFLAAGFAVNRFLIPTLVFGLQQVKVEEDDDRDGDDSSTTFRQWELRPSLEVAILPGMRIVPFASAGLSLARRVAKGESGPFEQQTKAFGVGPAISVGVHGFLAEHASLDLSLTYRALFFGKTKASGALDADEVEKKQRDHALLLNLGASFWI
jgi:hypothetical protein